jgi:hypothetical protein
MLNEPRVLNVGNIKLGSFTCAKFFNVPKAKMTNEKNGTHVSNLIIKNFHKQNRKMMTSSKIQINFYRLSLTKTNIYQYNMILPSLVWHNTTR